MKPAKSSRPAGAFTLVELLTVIAIIGILAALLLPVLQRGKDRAKRVWCENNLAQMGIAFHSFAHDHNSKFPAQVPLAEGGADGLVVNGVAVHSGFDFVFLNFQALASDLGTPKILICPTDATRLPAANFTSLKNTNLSYFLGYNADYNQPADVLAGDRNLASLPNLTFYNGSGQQLRWSGIMHRFKGNVLFADGHVEELSSHQSGGLVIITGNSVPPSGGADSQPAGQPNFSSPPSGVSQNAAAPEQPAQAGGVATHPAASPPLPFLSKPDSNAPVGQRSSKANLPPAIVSRFDVANPNAEIIPVPTNVSGGVLSSPSVQEPEMSPLNQKLTRCLRRLFGWGYLLLLLLLLLFLAYKYWRWWCQRHR